jgi:hypothetical protein
MKHASSSWLTSTPTVAPAFISATQAWLLHETPSFISLHKLGVTSGGIGDRPNGGGEGLSAHLTRAESIPPHNGGCYDGAGARGRRDAGAGGAGGGGGRNVQCAGRGNHALGSLYIFPSFRPGSRMTTCRVEPRPRMEAITDMWALKETFREAFECTKSAPSASQQQVSDMLRHMGLSVDDEVRCPKSRYFINMCTTGAGGREARGAAARARGQGSSMVLRTSSQAGRKRVALC